MSRGINKAILVGNLAADPEYRVLNNGENCVATVSLATNESFKDQQGNIQDRTEWHRLVFWGRLAEIAHQYLTKGAQVYVEGKIRTRSYDDQQTGEKNISLRFKFLTCRCSVPSHKDRTSNPMFSNLSSHGMVNRTKDNNGSHSRDRATISLSRSPRHSNLSHSRCLLLMPCLMATTIHCHSSNSSEFPNT
jgi:single stranded DNA-binding protein